MPHHRSLAAPMVFWTWGDEAIENPRIIKTALEALHETGVAGFLVILKGTRYTLLDRRVIRTVSQVSQWSKRRNMRFWLHMDPRHASRRFIDETGERLHFLLSQTANGRLPVAAMTSPRFEIEFDWSQIQSTPWLQESAIAMRPVGLEKAFLFSTQEGRVVPASVNDITPHTQMVSDMARGRSTVFGEIHLPEDENWYVCAFPRFESNLYDYAGRSSNDFLSQFIENLFDGCTHLDGVAWAEGGSPALVPTDRIPVSLSILNAFRAEMGYDLRDKLYALAFETSDRSHLQIRHDYFDFLNRTLLQARGDFHRMLHSFFPGVHLGMHHQRLPAVSAAQRNAGCVDPYRNIRGTAAGFCLIEEINGHWKDALLARLIGLKSLAAQGQRPVYCSLPWERLSPKDQALLIQWLRLYGIQPSPLIHHSGELSEAERTALEGLLAQGVSGDDGVSPWPIADTAFIYPFEALSTTDLSMATDRVTQIAKWIAELSRRGVQLDVVSSIQLKQATLEGPHLKVGTQKYRALIYPFATPLSDPVIQALRQFQTNGLSIYLLGAGEGMKLDGTPIAGLELPRALGVDDLFKLGLDPLITPPQGALAALYATETGWEVRCAPQASGATLEGPLTVHGISTQLPPSQGLARVSLPNAEFITF